MPCLDGQILERCRQDGHQPHSTGDIRERLSQPPQRKRRKAKLKEVCRRGHPLQGANVIYEAKGTVRRCLMCRQNNLNNRLRRNHQPLPSTTGVCKRGLHAWIEDNWVIDKRTNAVRCRPCREKAHREVYARSRVIPCVVKNCPRATHRGEGNYICKQHRAEPPAWIERAGLQIVGTRLVPL